MISKKTIDSIYKQYSSAPESPDCLDIMLLFEKIHPDHKIEIDGENLIINSVEQWSPFHNIPLDRIFGIVDFEENVAIVLRNSIIFLGKRAPSVNIHIKPQKDSLMSKVMNMLSKN